MDKKYNGFNNGRDTTDGVGGWEVNHGTQQTMTKEQILPTVTQMDAAIDTIITKMYGGLESASIEHFLETGKVNGSFRERLYDCIKTTFMLVDIKQKTEYLNAKQEVAKEREKAKKMMEAAKSVMKSWNERMNNEIEEEKENKHGPYKYWSPAASMVASSEINKLRQSLTEYEKL